MKFIKIQKFIANLGYCSRRKAETLIKQNRVSLQNSNKIIKLGDRISENSKLKIDGKILNNNLPKKTFLILNKPIGYVSTTHDEHGRKTALDLIKNKISNRVFIVGRLDLNSHGLMLFTNDGDMAYKIMHPKFRIKKTYVVQINRVLNFDELNKLKNGVFIDGNKTAPVKIKIKSNFKTNFTIKIELIEGKKRQIRKMVETLNNAHVVDLKRIQIGNIKLNNLPLGKSRFLNSNEISNLLL